MENKVNSISAIWLSDKKKTVNECSNEVFNFLLLLKDHNLRLYSNWYEKGNSKKEALSNHVHLEQNYFFRDIKQKWDKRFEDLGVRLSYWSGNKKDSKSAEISFKIGAYGNKPFNKNSCVITLPDDEDFYNSNDNVEHLINLMKSYWKPDKLLINGEPLGNGLMVKNDNGTE